MKNYKDYFRNKKVTLMGLGLLGRGLGDAIFLAEHGADLIVTDLRGEKVLVPSLAKLKKFKNIRYTLGQHKLEDFRYRDFVIKAAGVPLDSPYIAEARKNGVPIEMDASLFAKLMPKGVTLVGITGTRGKSTVTALVHDILDSSFRKGGGESASRRIFKGGNLVSEATLPLLEKVKADDIVVLELDSWQLQGFHDAKISPQVAVFTTFLDDHMVYYKGDTDRYFEDKAAIFKYQKEGDTFIVGEQILPRFDLKSGKRSNLKRRAVVIVRAADVPKDWRIPLLGEHNLENIAAARAAAKALGVPDAVIKKTVENFKPVAGRLEYLRTVRGVKIYNDNNATTPDATIAALRALSGHRVLNPWTPDVHRSRNIVLIMGGTDKGLDMSKLVAEIPKHCKAVILLEESGTSKIRFMIHDSRFKNVKLKKADGLKACVEEAMKLAAKGDIILFSPAFASFGKWFKNEYDRGSQFVTLVEKL